MEYLFSYGTLQDEQVQLKTFGRTLTGEPDVLPGYREGRVPIRRGALTTTSSEYHINAEFTGQVSDSIGGMVFQVTAGELKHADEYEATASYKRIRVEMKSGKQAWVYVFDASLPLVGT